MEIFTPILDNGTTQKGLKQDLQIGGLFGGGVAYELSPSWDIRAEYRGFMMKAPTFGATDGLFTTNRYYILMTPSTWCCVPLLVRLEGRKRPSHKAGPLCLVGG